MDRRFFALAAPALAAACGASALLACSHGENAAQLGPQGLSIDDSLYGAYRVASSSELAAGDIADLRIYRAPDGSVECDVDVTLGDGSNTAAAAKPAALVAGHCTVDSGAQALVVTVGDDFEGDTRSAFTFTSDGIDLTLIGAGTRKTFLRKSREFLLAGTYAAADDANLAPGDVTRLVVERTDGAPLIMGCDAFVVTANGSPPVDLPCTFVEYEDKFVAYAGGGAVTYKFAVTGDAVDVVAPNAKTRATLSKR